MTDTEIREYLERNNYEVNAQDCIRRVFNTSTQILSTKYDFENKTMTVITKDNRFIFRWKLNKII
jgi:hypothetical protein